MNPAQWETARLAKDSANQYFGGGPFGAAYGGAQGPASPSSQVAGALDSYWGKPVVVTTAVGAGTILAGAFDSAAQIYRRGGASVEMTNAHSDLFLKNMVAGAS